MCRYILVDQCAQPGAAAAAGSAGRMAGCTFIRVKLDTRQHIAEVGQVGGGGGGGAVYSVIYDQQGCNSRPTVEQLRHIDEAADDLHGKVSFLGGNLPSVGLLAKLDAILNQTEADSDGFMVVKQPPSYLVVKSQLVAEFGDATFKSCREQVVKRLNEASSTAAASPSRGGGGGGGGGGGTASSTGAVVNAAGTVRPRQPWTMIAPAYAAFGGRGPSARPTPPAAITPMPVHEYTVDFTLCERVLRDAQERKVAEAERVALKAARRAAADEQA